MSARLAVRFYAQAVMSVAALLTGSVGSGCSLLAVDGPVPASQRRGAPLVCETSFGLPVLDFLSGTAVLTNYALGTSASYSEYALADRPRPGIALAELGAFALLATSAVVGYARVSRCRAAFKAIEVREDE